MKNRELFELINKLDTLKNLSGAIFSYKIISNKKSILNHYQTYEEMIKPSEEYKQYDKQRISLCDKYADVGDDGKVIINNNAYQITQFLSQFNEELIVLNNENLPILTEYANQMRNGRDFLEQDAEVELKLINIEELPKDINVEQMEVIMNFMN